MFVIRDAWRWVTADWRRSFWWLMRIVAAGGLLVIALVIAFFAFVLVGLSWDLYGLGIRVLLWAILPILLWLAVIILYGQIVSPKTLWRRARFRFSRRLETKLLVSHVLVVSLSLFVFAFLGFLLFLWLTWMSEIKLTTTQQAETVMSLTLFTLILIAVITMCSIVVALLASRYMASRLASQIMELESATVRMSDGHLDARVPVLSEDELGELAQRFNDFAARLEELDTQRKSFVANVSHDLRTPIAIIRGHVDSQLREPDEETASPEVAFHSIEHEVETLGRLVDDLFTLSRLEEAALPMANIPVNLGELIDDTVRGIRPYALKQARVSVNAACEVGLRPVLGDPMRLTQILNNLLHNAIRHTPEGGIVMAAAENVPATSQIRLAVTDTGVGMSSEQVQRVFDRFYQGESRREGGAGLGLSIVKQLVDAQGGTIDVESREGEGTTFTIHLPMA